MTICANCGKNFGGIDRLCPDCEEEYFIANPKTTGWTNDDDEILKEALDIIGMDNENERWTAAMRLSGVSRLSVAWLVEDIRRARARIGEIVAHSLDQFQEG